ncbi:MAG: hypothetical protein ACR2G0_00050 [Chthoniobacterales bacterium]
MAKQVIDDRTRPNQTAIMKYLPHLLLATVTALSLASCAAPGGAAGGAAVASEMGPHSAQKFILVHRAGVRAIDPSTIETMCLVLTVEQKMNGNQQEVTAKAAAHKDGPEGSLLSAQGVQVVITSPGKPSASEAHSEVGTVSVTKSIPAPGGKYQTVTAEATIKNPEYSDGHVMLSIPGGQ